MTDDGAGGMTEYGASGMTDYDALDDDFASKGPKEVQEP